MRVLVCGGRDFNDRDLVSKSLSFLTPADVVIEGGARGADRLGFEFATLQGIPTVTFKADWDRFGKSAGCRRNEQMLVEGKPDLVVAFPGGRGTEHMVASARKAGVEVRLVS